MSALIIPNCIRRTRPRRRGDPLMLADSRPGRAIAPLIPIIRMGAASLSTASCCHETKGFRRMLLPLVAGVCAMTVSPAALAADNGAGNSKAEPYQCVPWGNWHLADRKHTVISGPARPISAMAVGLLSQRTRKSEVMAPAAEQLSNEDIPDLVGLFSALKPPSSSGQAAGDWSDLTEAGKRAASVGRCTSSHDENFAGRKAVAWPAGQRENYINQAPHDYKSGVRMAEA